VSQYIFLSFSERTCKVIFTGRCSVVNVDCWLHIIFCSRLSPYFMFLVFFFCIAVSTILIPVAFRYSLSIFCYFMWFLKSLCYLISVVDYILIFFSFCFVKSFHNYWRRCDFFVIVLQAYILFSCKSRLFTSLFLLPSDVDWLSVIF
jgi:hypothetical protein